MEIERFSSKEVNRDKQGLYGKVDHFSPAHKSEANDLLEEQSIIERVIAASDSATAEELANVLGALLNQNGYPAKTLEELNVDGVNELNRIVGKYWEATKALKLTKEAKAQYNKELVQLLG